MLYVLRYISVINATVSILNSEKMYFLQKIYAKLTVLAVINIYGVSLLQKLY